MKMNEEMVFDELMRQKLESYSELPDMGLMDNIHAKKNRVMKLYKLSKFIAILCIVGVGVFAAYLQLDSNSYPVSTNNQLINNTINNLSESNNNHVQGSWKATAISSSTNSSLPSINQTSGNVQSETHSSLYIPNNCSTAKTNSTTIITLPKPNNSSPNLSLSNTTKPDSADAKKGDQKQKKQISVNCKAAFDYYVSYDGKYIFSNFSETESSSKTLWDFGDGTTADIASPEHIYKNAGTYLVTLKITDIANSCSDMLQKNIAINTSIKKQKQSIEIKGRVIAGSDPIENGNVYLLQFNSEKNNYTRIARSGISLSGEYLFRDIKNGTYVLLGEVNSAKYIPTYWGNSTDLNDAVEIHIMENDDEDMSGLNISMTYNKDFINNENAHIFNRDTQNYVLVLDQNNNIVGTAKIDKNGDVNLNGFPPGNYNLLNQQTGNINTVKVIPGGGYSLGGDISSINNGKITLVPNPAISNVKFSINIQNENQVADIMIMNVGGSIVYHKSYTCSTGSYPFDIDISSLPPGEYYVVVNVGGSQTLTGRMIKSGNNSNDNR